MELARVDAVTGAVVATNTFSPGWIGAPLAAAGSLWLTGSFSGHAMLLRLDARTLMVTGELTIAPVNSDAAQSHIAYAGGSIWVDGSDQLVRVSPATVAVELTIPLPSADTSDVGASPDGGTLIVSESDGGDGTIQRRDPATGTLLASHPMLGVIAPLIGGVSAAGAWVSEPTGMLGYIERFSAASMTPQAGTKVGGANGIHADVWSGVLWVRDQAGGAAQNYCADPATGRRRATLPLPDLGQDYLMAVTGGRIYYAVPVNSGFAIRAVPVPAACG
jgi:DNA-binding beta-propeller fold protein YncE